MKAAARRRARLAIIGTDPVELTEDEIEICDICGAEVYVGMGIGGFGVYTVTKQGDRRRSMRTRSHFPGQCDFKKWLKAGDGV